MFVDWPKLELEPKNDWWLIFTDLTLELYEDYQLVTVTCLTIFPCIRCLSSDGSVSKADVSVLAKALQAEKRKSAALTAQLRNALKGQAQRNEWLEEPSDCGDQIIEFMPRNSTMREISRPSANDSSFLTSMSFASLQVTECKPMDGEDEVDKKTFEQWKEHFEAAMQFAGITSESMKMSAFKMKAGRKLIDVLEGTPPNDASDAEMYPYSNVMERLRSYYGSRDYGLLQRQKLRSMAQNPGESDLKYVKRVTVVAKLCDYKDEQMMETVTDVIQAHALNSRVRMACRKVLRKGGTMAELLDKVRACEIETLNEEMFARNHHQDKPPAEVAAVSYGQRSRNEFRSGGFERGPMVNRQISSSYQQRNWGAQRGRGQVRGGFTRSGVPRYPGAQREQCWRCTSNYHAPEACHAIDKRCRNCQAEGHLARACRVMVPDKMKRRFTDEDEISSASKTRKIAAIMGADQSATEKESPDEQKTVSASFLSDNK